MTANRTFSEFDKSSATWSYKPERIPLDTCYLGVRSNDALLAGITFSMAEARLGSDIANHPNYNNTVVQGRMRETIAELLGAHMRDVSLKVSTNDAVMDIALGYPFRRGDEIVVYANDYPSVRQPFEARAGLLKVVELQGRHSPSGKAIGWDIEELEQTLEHSARVRMVVISHVQFISGHTADLPRLAEICRAKNIDLVVDLAQSAGVVPVNPDELGLSAVVFPLWKGLMGERGVAALWTAPDFRRRIEIVKRGPDVKNGCSFYYDPSLPDHTDGRAFQPSTLPTRAYVSSTTSLAMLLRQGIERTGEEIRAHQRYFLKVIERDFAVPIGEDNDPRGLIVSFLLPHHPSKEGQEGNRPASDVLPTITPDNYGYQA